MAPEVVNSHPDGTRGGWKVGSCAAAVGGSGQGTRGINHVVSVDVVRGWRQSERGDTAVTVTPHWGLFCVTGEGPGAEMRRCLSGITGLESGGGRSWIRVRVQACGVAVCLSAFHRLLPACVDRDGRQRPAAGGDREGTQTPSVHRARRVKQVPSQRL